LCYTLRPNEPVMTPERWQKLKELCHLALEREPSQRAPFLAEACRDDEELRREAESLIARATVDPATLDDSPEQLAGTVIGHYHLLQKIGEGGMGEVWLAEQKEPVRRRVALKLVKAGMNTREVIGRFESERQALALMEHPAIARVFEAGSTIHEHSHPQEEVWNVIEGELEVTIGGKTQVAGPGFVAIVPPNTNHFVRAITDGRAIVVDYPLRREMNGTKP